MGITEVKTYKVFKDSRINKMKKALRLVQFEKDAHIKSADIIKKGGVAIVPTETVYGFAVNAFDLEAQKKVYAIKGRNYKNRL